MKYLKCIPTALALMLVMVTGSLAQDTAAAPVGEMTTGQYVQKAAEGNRAEIELGQLALRKSEDQQVQQLAGRIIDDHRAANSRLQEIAEVMDIRLGEGLTQRHRQLMQRLSELTGDEFNREYLEAIVQAHRNDLVFYDQHAEDGETRALRRYFSSTMPTLATHLEIARNILYERNWR